MEKFFFSKFEIKKKKFFQAKINFKSHYSSAEIEVLQIEKISSFSEFSKLISI